MTKALEEHRWAEAEQAFRNYLKRNRIRYTRPREVILKTVLESKNYFDVEQLVAMLHQQGEQVGTATVYRTLPLLVDCGILKQVQFSEQQAHYEFAFGEDPHDHMVCRRCGRIIKISAHDIAHLRNEIASAHAFHAVSHRFQISGLCKECVQSCPVAMP